MLKRFRHSSIHRALTWLVLCVWLTLVGAAGIHHHPVSCAATQDPASAASSIAARQASGRSSHLAAADNDDECGVCKWLCAVRHALLACPMRVGLTRAAMPEHPLARPPTCPVIAFASASRGPPAFRLPSKA